MTRTRIGWGTAMFAATLALAACGSSGSSKASSSSTTTTTAASSSTSGAAASGTPVVKTASNAKFGTIAVDTDGKTLYTLTNNGQAVPCSGACLSAWPPLLLPAGATSATGAGVSGLGTVAASGGTQVTAGGLPLYRFSGDAAAGDANGDRLRSFGGVWQVVQVGGAAAGTTTSSSGGGGLGY